MLSFIFDLLFAVSGQLDIFDVVFNSHVLCIPRQSFGFIGFCLRLLPKPAKGDFPAEIPGLLSPPHPNGNTV